MLDGRSRPDRAARFYARFGITEAQFKSGVPGFPEPDFWEGVPGRRELSVADAIRTSAAKIVTGN